MTGNCEVVRTSNNDFTTDLYQALFPKASDGNLVFSPFSLHTVLGMLGVGARGNTRAEIFEGLKLTDEGDDVICKSYNSVISGIHGGGSTSDDEETFTLLTANRIYSQVGFELNQKYANCLKDSFMAEIEQLNTSTAKKCKAAAARINQWVASITNNKIDSLISPDLLGPDTSLILINGVYFKGLWEDKFNPKATSKKLFKLDNKQKVYVDMMNIRKEFPYAELPELDAEAVALPYKGGRISMIIILPKAVDGLNKLQSSIGSILQGRKSLITETLEEEDIKLSLPKFRVETTIENLMDVLKKLGMKSIFSPGDADFSGTSISDGDKPELFVSDVVQKAYIEVNEEGAEAAAATYAGSRRMCSGGPPDPPIRFVVDRPFYFQIVDHSNGDLVLFAGHCNDPRKND